MYKRQDLGGGSPGLDTESTDIFQEGLRLPPSRYNLKCDWNGGAFERLIAANVRVPDLTIGDFNAQHAANAIGAARVQQLCAKYGAELIAEVMRNFIDYSERRMRAAIAKVPNGVYFGEDAIDDDGVSDVPLVIKVKVDVKDEDIYVDFTGTCAQVMRNVNCPLSSTHAATLSCIKSVVTTASIPFNEGIKRPIHITVPEGSLLNPLPPAPVRARMEAGYRVFDALMKALAQAVPRQVIAPGFDTTTVVCFSCLASTGFKVNIDIFGGGFGAGPTADGCDAVDLPLSNCSNNPVEVLDAECDFFRVIGSRLEPDSFGHGEFRGGAGFSRRYEVLADNVKLAIYSDRFRIRPSGLFGGTEAMPGRCTIQRAGERIEMASKSSYALRKGDIVEMFVGGGGGYGSPARRAPNLIERDLSEGLLTPEAAGRFYGVGGAAARSAGA